MSNQSVVAIWMKTSGPKIEVEDVIILFSCQSFISCFVFSVVKVKYLEKINLVINF